MTKNKIKLVTHSGSFHADDVFACATLAIKLEKENQPFEIIRTRDEAVMREGDFVFDVGGSYDPEKNLFDHHQKGGAGKRENGIEYSSFGLVWKKFGDELTGASEITKRVDERLVQIIDATDNGIDIANSIIPGVAPYSIYDIIWDFHPSYKEEDPDFYQEFLEAVAFAKMLLQKEIGKAKDQEEIHAYLEQKVANLNPESKILIFDEYLPRVEIWNNLIPHPDILYVVCPGSKQVAFWRVLGLRKNMNLFELRKDLPAAWAGMRDAELEAASGVKDVVFCHRGLFMAVTKTKEAAVKLAEKALLA